MAFVNFREIIVLSYSSSHIKYFKISGEYVVLKFINCVITLLLAYYVGSNLMYAVLEVLTMVSELDLILWGARLTPHD